MNQMDEPLHDLIEIIHFAEKVSAKIHGLQDEAEIYRTIREESAQSKYTVSILLLTNDKSGLTIAETFIPYQKLKKAEKVTGLALKRYTIDLEKSTIYSQVVREGKTIQANVGDIIDELVPQPGAAIISALFGYKERSAILTPLKRHGKIIGALAMSSTQLAEYFIPSVKSLAEHISTALELSYEYAKRKKAEESLMESEEALKVIMENVNDIIFQLNSSFLITYVSPTVRDYGYEPEDLIGNHLRMTTPAHEVQRALKVVESVISGNTVENFEIEQLDSKGKLIPMEINFAPVVKEGQVVAVQGVMRDITERKQAEKEKDRILHDLGERVKELSCLYKIDEITKRDVTVEEVLEETVHVIPPSWQYPEITGSRIAFEDREYKTGNFRKTQWMQKADVYVNDKKVGVVQVCYTDEKPPEDEGPFSREERNLINSIAKRLGDFIERKKAEEALKRTEKKFRDFFDYASDAICIHDLEGHILEVNRTLCERLEYTKEELLQMTLMGINSAEYAALVPERIEELKKKRHLFFETAHVTKDGRKIPIELSSRIIEHEGGQAVLSIARDVTERKQAKEELQQSELRYRTLFESVPVGVGIATFEGKVLAYNDAMLETTGYSRAEIEHIDLRDMYENPEERALLLDQIQEKGVVHDFGVQLKRKDGTPYYANLTAALVTLDGRNVILTAVKDITERKQAEEKLRESEEKYRDLVENITNVIYSADAKGVITYVSPAVEPFVGYSPSEVIGRHFSTFIYDEDLPRLRESFHSILSGNTTTNEYRVFAKSGEIRWICTSSRPVFAKDRIIGVQGVLSDITERKQAEDTLKYRLDFEELIATISTYFINLSPDEIDEGITLALEKVGRFTGVDRCDVFLLYDNGTKMDNAYEWCAEGVESRKDQLKGLDVEPLRWGIGQLRKLKVLSIPCVADLPEEASADKEVLQAEGIQSLLNVPIFIGGVLFGFVGLESLHTKRTWSDDTISMLKMVTEIFANALERKRSEEMLQESEEQYRTTIDSMGDAIHVVDNNLRIVLSNEAFKNWCTKLGLDTDAVGKTPFELFSFLPDRIYDEFRQVFSTKKTVITEERTTILGKEFVSETRKIPIVEEGKVRRVVTVVHDITERKRAEEQLQASEEKFRTLFENQGVGIALGELSAPSTGEIRPMEFNAALLKFLGYTEKEFRAKTMADLSHPEDVKKDVELLNKALAENHDSYEMEKRFIRKDGQIVWGHLTVSLLRDAHGNPTHVIGSVQDITEQRRSQEALRKSEEEFRLAFENAKDAIFWADPETGLVIRCNKAAETLLEKKREEIIGCHQTDVHPPEKATYYRDVFKRHTLQKETEDVEAEVITTSGKIRPVHISASLTMVGGKLILQGIFRDITERKKAEEALRESEEKYRTLVEQSLQGIAIVQGIPLHVVFANTALAEISGYTVEEILSFPLEDARKMIYPEDSSFTLERYRDRLKGEPVLPRYEFRIIRKDGEVRWLELHVSRIEYQGSPAVQAAIMDITERKKAEEQIKQSLREKEVLLREIHHRVKNNLQVVSSLLNLQSSHCKDRQYTELLKESQNRIKTMALIHEKLYQSENLADINFNEYISTLVQGLVRFYKAERVALTLDVGDVSLGIDAAIPCGLIINELVSNSLKHAFPDKKGEIEIKLHPVNGKIELVVADNGIGIPDTVDFKNTETLGLDLVTTLAEEQLNGGITLDKTKGTAFTITFEEVI